MLEKTPTLIALLTALLTGFSVLYDWTYFFFIDISFFKLLSITDHIFSVLETLPFMLFLLLVIATFLVVPLLMASRSKSPRDDLGVYPLELGFASVLIPFPKWKISLPVIIIFGLISTFFYPLGAVFIGFYTLVFYLSLVAVALIATRHSSIAARRAISYGYLIWLTAFSAMFFGTLFAVAELTTENSDGHSYTLALVSGETLERLQLLRATTHGLILRDVEKQINMFVTWDEVVTLQRPREFDGNSLACKWFGICWIDELMPY